MAIILKESVVRNLTKTIAAVSILAPATAFPLGIGDIKLHSALNQKLDAEIALILSANENASDIKVRLAPPEKFDEAGVPWSYFLSKIKFNSVVRADGSSIVKLSSNEALREPFLDFLLEVSWKNGSIYREFTVLVDPPVAYTQPVIPVVTKAESVDAAVPAPTPTPLPSVDQKQAVVSKAVVDPVESSAEYGPTRRSDSLWKVAKRTNAYNDVSIEQMMMAIYEANPKSFFKDNVNALMAGQTLDIPEREVILKLSHKQALAEFKQHNNVWKGRVVAKAKKKKPIIKNAADIAKAKVEEINTQLELEAPVDEEIVENAIVIGKDAAASKDTTLQKQQGLASTSDEGLALQARMAKLEQQLMTLQKMLTLKDEQLAALQSKVQTIKDPKAQTVTEQKASATKQVESTQPKKPVVETKPAVQPEAVKPKAATKPKPKPKAQPAIQEQPEEGIMSSPLFMSLGGLGIAILGVLGLFLWRKQKAETESDTESMFATASEISLPDSEEDFNTPLAATETDSYDVGTVGESSFLSEFTPSDFDAFDTDQNEVDPISEADVYLAYGRYQQAEDLMRQAIEDQPERDECKLKLLEIFYANENKTSFAEFASELVSSGKNNDQEFWAKVVEMGAELDPESSLYSADAGGETETLQVEQALTPESSESTEAGGNEADFDLSVFDPQDADSDPDIELQSDAENPSDSLDFDLSVFDLDEETTAQAEGAEESTNEIESIDFDLTSTDADEPVESSHTETADEELESFEFDMTTEPSTSDDSNESVDLNTEADLGESIELLPEEAAPEELELTLNNEEQAASGETSDVEDFDFDFDPPGATASDEPSNVESANDVSDLTDMDELETKIDLAKAYIDMGDADAAKGIAKEVLEKGSEEQKVAAQAVIDQLE